MLVQPVEKRRLLSFLRGNEIDSQSFFFFNLHIFKNTAQEYISSLRCTEGFSPCCPTYLPAQMAYGLRSAHAHGLSSAMLLFDV